MAQKNQSNPILYGVGVISMMLSLSLFVFSLYIIPHILFNMTYDVPEFITIVSYWYNVVRGLSGLSLAATIILPYVLSAAILGLIAKRLTRRVEGGENIANFSSRQNIIEMLKPALYEIVLISAVLASLFFAIFPIVIKFD